MAAGALTVGMMGDALAYAVVPAAAATYGLGAVGVSLVLSVNRFVRLALNPMAALWLRRVGLRHGTIVGVGLAIVSTVGYALAPALGWLLVARVTWGAAFATLRLTMLGYATEDAARAPRRVGLASSVQEFGPMLALIAGASLLGVLGARPLFGVVALATVLALPLALALPRAAARVRTAPAEVVPDTVASAAAAPAARAPHGTLRASLATATVAFGVDGALTAGVVLTLVAFGATPTVAATVGGTLLAARKVAQIVVSASAGALAQRVGLTGTVAVALLGAAAGLAAVAAGAVVVGSLVAMASAAAVAALTPAALASGDGAARMRGLGWLTTARDLGAATGAAFAPLALLGSGAADVVAWTFGVTAAAVVVAAAVWVVSAP